jgi:hypothetical protein
MANMKMVNGVVVPCTAQEESDIAQRASDFQANQAAYAKVQYLIQRKDAYPSVQDQLLMLWSSMDSGEIPKSAAFYNAIAAVNKQYPAPSINPTPSA